MKHLPGLIVMLIATVTFVSAQEQGATSAVGRVLSKVEQEVIKLEREWLDAYEKRDAAAMARIVADDFTIIYPNGSVRRKAEVVENLKRGASNPAPNYHTENVESRVYSDTVILVGIVISEWTRDGQKMRDRSRYTDVYVRRNGRWQVVASHLSNAEELQQAPK